MGNKLVDILADKGVEDTPIFTPLLNPYHNQFVLRTTRKKKSKYATKPIINTSIRKEIKQLTRDEIIKKVYGKDKYVDIIKYESKISKLSSSIIKTKLFTFEDEKKQMIRMIHGGLPTCEKMNRLVSAEKSNNSKYNTESTFFSKKYEKVTNNGDCPCCRWLISYVGCPGLYIHQKDVLLFFFLFHSRGNPHCLLLFHIFC